MKTKQPTKNGVKEKLKKSTPAEEKKEKKKVVDKKLTRTEEEASEVEKWEEKFTGCPQRSHLKLSNCNLRAARGVISIMDAIISLRGTNEQFFHMKSNFNKKQTKAAFKIRRAGTNRLQIREKKARSQTGSDEEEEDMKFELADLDLSTVYEREEDDPLMQLGGTRGVVKLEDEEESPIIERGSIDVSPFERTIDARITELRNQLLVKIELNPSLIQPTMDDLREAAIGELTVEQTSLALWGKEKKIHDLYPSLRTHQRIAITKIRSNAVTRRSVMSRRKYVIPELVLIPRRKRTEFNITETLEAARKEIRWMEKLRAAEKSKEEEEKEKKKQEDNERGMEQEREKEKEKEKTLKGTEATDSPVPPVDSTVTPLPEQGDKREKMEIKRKSSESTDSSIDSTLTTPAKLEKKKEQMTVKRKSTESTGSPGPSIDSTVTPPAKQDKKKDQIAVKRKSKKTTDSPGPSNDSFVTPPPKKQMKSSIDNTTPVQTPKRTFLNLSLRNQKLAESCGMSQAVAIVALKSLDENFTADCALLDPLQLLLARHIREEGNQLVNDWIATGIKPSTSHIDLEEIEDQQTEGTFNVDPARAKLTFPPQACVIRTVGGFTNLQLDIALRGTKEEVDKLSEEGLKDVQKQLVDIMRRLGDKQLKENKATPSPVAKKASQRQKFREQNYPSANYEGLCVMLDIDNEEGIDPDNSDDEYSIELSTYNCEEEGSESAAAANEGEGEGISEGTKDGVEGKEDKPATVSSIRRSTRPKRKSVRVNFEPATKVRYFKKGTNLEGEYEEEEVTGLGEAPIKDNEAGTSK